MPSKQFHLHTVNLYCFSPLLDHLIQSCYPEDLQEALRPFDDAILTTAKLALGMDLADQIALRRARLPPSRSGLLLRQRGGHGGGFLPDAVFWGAAAQANPSFADRPGAPGFLPELVDVVGAGSFEQGGGRFAHLPSLRVHAQVAQRPGYECWISGGGGGDGGGWMREEIPTCAHC
jgi:hypothetical protein